MSLDRRLLVFLEIEGGVSKQVNFVVDQLLHVVFMGRRHTSPLLNMLPRLFKSPSESVHEVGDDNRRRAVHPSLAMHEDVAVV